MRLMQKYRYKTSLTLEVALISALYRKRSHKSMMLPRYSNYDHYCACS